MMAESSNTGSKGKTQNRPRQSRPPRAGQTEFRSRHSNPQSTSANVPRHEDSSNVGTDRSHHQPSANSRNTIANNSSEKRSVVASLNPTVDSFRPRNVRTRHYQGQDVNRSTREVGSHGHHRDGRMERAGGSNWRNQPHDSNESRRDNSGPPNKLHVDIAIPKKSNTILDPNADPESQRAKLEEQLSKGTYECMICCEEIRTTEFIWSCTDSCFNIFHLACISTWACSLVTQNDEQNNPRTNISGWRCPACQYVIAKVPNRYFCFCGKRRNPDIVTRREIESSPDHRIPHTCGQMCLRRKNGKNSKCPHKCKLNCHPGPCPPCVIGTTQSCSCGRTSRPVKCGESGREIFTCESICGKQLKCTKHKCTKTCHEDDCGLCKEDIVIKCFCGKSSKKVKCGVEISSVNRFECGETCDRQLSCGNHTCKKSCHPGPCNECELSSKVIQTCPCGKKKSSDLTNKVRKSCLDEIPVCGSVCEKDLICGPDNDRHKCARKCHVGNCSRCKLKTIIRCSCGKNSLSVECKELDGNRTFKCTMTCNKKMACGRHKCSATCCEKPANNHPCDQICNKKLSCGIHSCQEICHSGPCQKCWNVGWEDLTCFCGSSVIHPPIHCGTQVPSCDKPCTRTHICDHPVRHPCHSEDTCPPCTFTSSKMCFGGHEVLRSVLCCLNGSSCGKTCAKKMTCRIHECQKVCHEGSCGTCTYPCMKQRGNCEHPCGLPCHEPRECPKSECKVPLSVHCVCKRLMSKMTCSKVNDELNNKIPFALMSKLRLNQDEEIDVNELIRRGKENKFCRIECDKTCLQLERNRNLAEALDIHDKPIDPIPAPNYNESLKQAALSDPQFVAYIYNTLSTLVNDVNKQTVSKFKFFNFPAMRADLRLVIHELSEFFGCKSHSNDQEPHRSVTVKASKGKCFIPSVSVMDVVEISAKTSVKPEKQSQQKKSEMTNLSSLKPVANLKVKKEPSNPVIDYFDFSS